MSEFIPHELCETGYSGECWRAEQCLRLGQTCGRYATSKTTLMLEVTSKEKSDIELIVRNSQMEPGLAITRALRLWQRSPEAGKTQ